MSNHKHSLTWPNEEYRMTKENTPKIRRWTKYIPMILLIGNVVVSSITMANMMKLSNEAQTAFSDVADEIDSLKPSIDKVIKIIDNLCKTPLFESACNNG